MYRARPRQQLKAELRAIMRNDFHIIPDADERRAGSVLARIYHEIGLAAVAQALRLPSAAFEPEMIELIERGESPPSSDRDVSLRKPGRPRKTSMGE